jgi:hypothetical protein
MQVMIRNKFALGGKFASGADLILHPEVGTLEPKSSQNENANEAGHDKKKKERYYS